jgi:hypothetical protein
VQKELDVKDQRSVPTTGPVCSVHLHPGSRLTRLTGHSPVFTTSTRPFSYGVLSSSGASKLFLSNTPIGPCTPRSIGICESRISALCASTAMNGSAFGEATDRRRGVLIE